MRGLTWVMGLFVIGVVGAKWVAGYIDDSGFKQDIATAPELATTGMAVRATSVANTVMTMAQQRGVTLLPGGLNVEVSAARGGSVQVQAGAMTMSGAPKQSVQDVSITVAYDRAVILGMKRRVLFTVNTTAHGSGVAESYPATPPDGAAALQQ